MAQRPASKQVGRGRSQQGDHVGEMGSTAVFLVLRVETVEEVAPFEDVPNLLDVVSIVLVMKPTRRTHHAGYTPDVCAGSPLGAEDDFRTAVLPRLDVVREVVLHPRS